MQSASLGWTGGVDAVAVAVDGDVVVEPAEGGEVVGVVVASACPGVDVVGLEPVAAGAAVDGAATVAPQHVAAGGGWDDPGSRGRRYRDPVLVGDYLYGCVAEETVEGGGTYPGTGSYLGACLACGGGGQVGVDEDGDERRMAGRVG